MATPELGLKRVCVSCGARFYDLNRIPAICPKCGTEQPTDLPRPKRGGEVPPDQVKSDAKDQNDEDVDVDLDTDDDSGDDVMEDTSDLDDDDDDLSTDIEVNTDNDEHEN
ncbi:FYDLN acid domain-containing protein [Kozakia baliensis]|uniref:FYDLN acid domain-containing protein n=1 Tax=Kozakia baliensis TaxID=153496 RepID=UPI00087CBD4C|nr:FYDLN acid domain-containing protein [Kozakia baliensis]AOX19166.1 hypothetical protein A0U90_01415 [Kozakia baliensis]